jgi:zinc and cadmium transporter
MPTTLLLIVYCILIVVASLAGGALPGLMKLTHRRMQVMMSFVGGLMLGVAVLHLIPHSLHEQGSIDRTAIWVLAGLLVMFLLIRVFHVHAHEHGDTSDAQDPHHHDHDHEGPCDHSHTHGHAHDHSPLTTHHAQHTHPFNWLGLAFGLSLHTLIDGLALGAAVAAESHEHEGFHLAGLATFLAVALHKPLDALSITSLMTASGRWPAKAIWLANFCFALMCPLGAIGFVFGLGPLVEQQVVIGCALAFAAGVFLCISLADLLPEVAFHAHDRIRLTLALAVGIALAFGIGYLEPDHAHAPASQGDGHDHGHGHAHP